MEAKAAMNVLLQLAYESALGPDFVRLEEAQQAVWEALDRLEVLEREREAWERRIQTLEARVRLLEAAAGKAQLLLIEALNLFRRGA